MSGGAFEYLCHKDISELMETVEDFLLDYAKHANSSKEKIDILSREIGFTWVFLHDKMNYRFKAI